MKKLLMIAALLVSTAALSGSYVCQLDNSPMMWTGRTTTSYGKMLYEYRCLQGHTSWVVQ